MITVGRVVRPQGHRGEVVVASETDIAAERFRVGAIVHVVRDGTVTPLAIRASREYDGRWIVGFDGVMDMNAAEAMRGYELRIPAASLRPLAADEFFEHDLVGCEVRTTDGRPIGTVRRIERGAGVPVLVVDAPSGKNEVLVPMVDSICRRVDVAGRVIVIDPPEGLVELNERP